jgi:hypothetical protein
LFPPPLVKLVTGEGPPSLPLFFLSGDALDAH